MRSSLFSVTLLFAGGIFSLASLAPCEPLGFAQSQEKFSISRKDKTIQMRGGALAAVQEGDSVKSADRHVQVQTKSGDTVLLQVNSTAQFASPDRVDVLFGDVVFAIQDQQSLKIGVDDMKIEPLGEKAGKVPFMVAVSRHDPDHVKVAGFSSPFTIKTGSEQLAVVASKDLVDLVKTEKGWQIAQNETPPAEGTAPAEGTTEEPTTPEDDEPAEKKKRRGTGFLFWANPAGAAFASGFGFFGLSTPVIGTITTTAVVAAVTTVAVTSNSSDDNNDDDDDEEEVDRQPASQIEPPQETPPPVLE